MTAITASVPTRARDLLAAEWIKSRSARSSYLVLLFAAWIFAVRWWYRLLTPRPALFRARCADGWELAVYHRPAPVRRETGRRW